MDLKNTAYVMLFLLVVNIPAAALGWWHIFTPNPGKEACVKHLDGIDPDRIGWIGPEAIVILASKGYRVTGCGTGTASFTAYDLHTENCDLSYDTMNNQLLLIDGNLGQSGRIGLDSDNPAAVPNVEELRLLPGFERC